MNFEVLMYSYFFCLRKEWESSSQAIISTTFDHKQSQSAPLAAPRSSAELLQQLNCFFMDLRNNKLTHLEKENLFFSVVTSALGSTEF